MVQSGSQAGQQLPCITQLRQYTFVTYDASAFSSTESTCTTDSCGTNDVRCCTGHERLVCILTMRKLTKKIERWLFITP